MTSISRFSILVAASLPFVALTLHAQTQPSASMPQFIRVTGESSSSSTPDEVMIDVGVTTQARTAQEAASENAKKVERMMAAVRKEAGEGATIRTIQYALNPDYHHAPDGNAPPRISSYTAYNMIRVRSADLTRVGRIIDAAIGAGANTIQSVNFAINERNKAHNLALAQATTVATAKAQAIAAALGMRVVRVMSVEEGGGMRPYPVYNEARRMDASTSIEPGAIDVTASVTLTVEIGA